MSFQTDLGIIAPVSTTTVGGVATSILTAGATPGWATVTAVAGEQQGLGSILFYREQIFLPLVTRSLSTTARF